MFSFSISCKDVGFMIYRLKSFCCKSFGAYFHLWGGGPNWCRDFALWRLEQESEWTTVGSKSKKSFADVVRSSSVPKRPVFLRLRYPDNYYENFDVLASGANKIPGVFNPRIPTPARSGRVLRCVPKSNSNPAPSKEKRSVDLNKVPSQEHSSLSNSKSNFPDPTASRVEIWPSPTAF